MTIENPLRLTLLIGELFWEQSENWEDIAQKHVEEISKLCTSRIGRRSGIPRRGVSRKRTKTLLMRTLKWRILLPFTLNTHPCAPTSTSEPFWSLPENDGVVSFDALPRIYRDFI